MALIVEDGTNVPDAESYSTVAQADAYFTARGTGLWFELTEEEKEQALRRATDFMVQRYRNGWKGQRLNPLQALDWPRKCVVIEDYTLPVNHMPREVIRGCAELALKAAAGPLATDATQKILQETVGPITMRYDPNSTNIIRYTAVDMLLSPFLGSGGNSAVVKLTRC
jgi:hypothetical protein